MMRIKDNKIDFPECSFGVLSNDIRSNFSFEERNKRYKAKNPNHHIGMRLQIDNGDTKFKQCDNGLLLDDSRFFLIELKGVDVVSACKQILTTLDNIKQKFNSYDFDFYGRIACKEGLPRANSHRQRLEKALGKNKLIMQGPKFEEEV